jgi:addiction module HigA family antidote
MPMKNPPHPGRSIKVDCLEPLGLSITEGANILGVARSTLSRVINGQASITPEMAIRLSKAFGSTAETWLKMQQAYDLAQMRVKEADIVLERYQPKEQEKALG